MTWLVEFLNDTVESELRVIPLDMQARFLRISQLIETHGLQHVHEPHIKHLDGDLLEIRLKGKKGLSRALYVKAKGQKVIVLQVF